MAAVRSRSDAGVPVARGAADGRQGLPSVDRLLGHPHMLALLHEHGHSTVVAALRSVLAEARAVDGAGAAPQAQPLSSPRSLTPPPSDAALLAACAELLGAAARPRLQAVFNLTGTVPHTNVGRPLLPQEAIDAVTMAMRMPANLEFDPETAGRGDRDDLVEGLLRELTGAEACTVVNNNAAAVFLVLNTLAQRREVIVSRGQLIEIGGAFHVPNIMSRAGAKLHEVGTTNRMARPAAAGDRPCARRRALPRLALPRRRNCLRPSTAPTRVGAGRRMTARTSGANFGLTIPADST